MALIKGLFRSTGDSGLSPANTTGRTILNLLNLIWAGIVAVITPAVTPVMYNVIMVAANTEYLQALPANAKKFQIKTRDGTAFRVAFQAGVVVLPGGPYTTVPQACIYWEDYIQPPTLTIYFASTLANRVVEITAWS